MLSPEGFTNKTIAFICSSRRLLVGPIGSYKDVIDSTSDYWCPLGTSLNNFLLSYLILITPNLFNLILFFLIKQFDKHKKPQRI